MNFEEFKQLGKQRGMKPYQIIDAWNQRKNLVGDVVDLRSKEQKTNDQVATFEKGFYDKEVFLINLWNQSIIDRNQVKKAIEWVTYDAGVDPEYSSLWRHLEDKEGK